MSAHVIIFPSPNGEHWNHTQFIKRKREVAKANEHVDKGAADIFLYNSVWSVQALKASSKIITGKTVREEEIRARVRLYSI